MIYLHIFFGLTLHAILYQSQCDDLNERDDSRISSLSLRKHERHVRGGIRSGRNDSRSMINGSERVSLQKTVNNNTETLEESEQKIVVPLLHQPGLNLIAHSVEHAIAVQGLASPHQSTTIISPPDSLVSPPRRLYTTAISAFPRAQPHCKERCSYIHSSAPERSSFFHGVVGPNHGTNYF